VIEQWRHTYVLHLCLYCYSMWLNMNLIQLLLEWNVDLLKNYEYQRTCVVPRAILLICHGLHVRRYAVYRRKYFQRRLNFYTNCTSSFNISLEIILVMYIPNQVPATYRGGKNILFSGTAMQSEKIFCELSTQLLYNLN
jgi:hypothetical protein